MRSNALIVFASSDVEFTTRSNASCNITFCGASDIKDHDGDIPASVGKRCKISSQKPCIVFIFRISGLSIYLKKICRACLISLSVATLFIDIPSNNSRNSLSVDIAQSRSELKIRLRISPAAAFVYVRHKIPPIGSSLRNKIRNNRAVKTLVFPVPAFAWTHTLFVGSAATSCSGESGIFFVIYILALCHKV